MGNTILLADKSTTIQKIVELTFDEDKYKIYNVNDGQAALDIIPQIRPDLVLADISLPVKSGYDVCLALRTDPQFSAFSTVPVILLAGIYDTMDEDRARQVEERVKQVQANDFLSKPFDPQLLITKVKQYLSAVGSSQEPPSLPIFAQEPDSAINLFDSEAAKPPDDSEKTMMLPGGPFGSMFAAEPAPYEEEPPAQEPPRVPVDIDVVKPVNEPVFGEESFPEVELGADQQEEENLLGQTTLRIEKPANEDQRFAGREEQEFEYKSGPVTEVPETAASEPGSIPLILPNAEDPFADVFQEPQSQWSSAAASEEDSPFGMPEPPAAPEIVEKRNLQRRFEKEPLVTAEPQQEAVTQNETFDDTWPGVPVRSNLTQPVEELFESEPVPLSMAEDAEELEADLSDGIREEPAPTPREAQALRNRCLHISDIG